ncbi:helix-turn-helix domain-containing protein [Escherichia coli]|nr:helix-turn-helix domain-containing protein [Escherichia coli]
MTTFTNKELIKEIKERISSLEVRDDIERRAYEIALVSLEVEPDEREAYELFMEKRFGDLVDRRRAKNGDNEYMAWDMTLGWIVWQQRWYPFFNNVTARGEIMEPYSLTLDEACHFLKISRPTAINWIRTGRLQATRKDPTKPKSPYLTTRQACIAALQSPLHTVQVSAGDGITEERKCHSSAEMKYGMPRIRSRAGNELRNLLAQRTSGKLRSCTTSEKQNSGE